MSQIEPYPVYRLLLQPASRFSSSSSFFFAAAFQHLSAWWEPAWTVGRVWLRLSFYIFLHTKYDNSCFFRGWRANLAEVKDELPWIQLSLAGFKGAEFTHIRIRACFFFRAPWSEQIEIRFVSLTFFALSWTFSVVFLEAIWTHFQPRRAKHTKWAVYENGQGKKKRRKKKTSPEESGEG